MKANITLFILLLIGNMGNAAGLRHKTCEISSRGFYFSPRIVGVSKFKFEEFDWSKVSHINDLFLNIGYKSKPLEAIVNDPLSGKKVPHLFSHKLKDGDLYTDLSITSANKGDEHSAYVIVEIKQRDSVMKDDKILYKVNSDKYSKPSKSYEEAAQKALAKAMSQLAHCEIE